MSWNTVPPLLVEVGIGSSLVGAIHTGVDARIGSMSPDGVSVAASIGCPETPLLLPPLPAAPVDSMPGNVRFGNIGEAKASWVLPAPLKSALMMDDVKSLPATERVQAVDEFWKVCVFCHVNSASVLYLHAVLWLRGRCCVGRSNEM